MQQHLKCVLLSDMTFKRKKWLFELKAPVQSDPDHNSCNEVYTGQRLDRPLQKLMHVAESC